MHLHFFSSFTCALAQLTMSAMLLACTLVLALHCSYSTVILSVVNPPLCHLLLNMSVSITTTDIDCMITLSQSTAIKILCADNNLEIDKLRPVNVPIDATGVDKVITSGINDDPLPACEHTAYRSAVGSVSYIASMTRPDIMYAVNLLARYLTKPTTIHMQAVLKVIHYLGCTSDVKLIFGGNQHTATTGSLLNSHSIVGFTDASWADDKSNRRSTSGGLISVFGSYVYWNAKQQKCVTLSSTESELYALSELMCEIIWTRSWLTQVFGDTIKESLLLVDNQSAIQLADHDSVHQRSKHIDLRYFWIREHVHSKVVQLKWIPTEHQLADILTKALPLNRYHKLRSQITLKQ